MKLYRHLLLALLLSAFSLNAENKSNSGSEAEADGRHDRDDGHDHDRDNCKLKGTYAYELSGSFGPTALSSLRLNEAGTLTFDGNGSGSGFGVGVLNGVRLNAEYIFTYHRLDDFVYEASGTRTSINGTTTINFVVGRGEDGEHISLVVLPNNPLIPLIPGAQIPLQALFNFVQTSGTGGK